MYCGIFNCWNVSFVITYYIIYTLYIYTCILVDFFWFIYLRYIQHKFIILHVHPVIWKTWAYWRVTWLNNRHIFIISFYFYRNKWISWLVTWKILICWGVVLFNKHAFIISFHICKNKWTWFNRFFLEIITWQSATYTFIEKNNIYTFVEKNNIQCIHL